MFRIIRLLAYLSLGYLAYEVYQGLAHDQQSGTGRSRRRERKLDQASGRMNVTGTGRGESTTTFESSGTMQRHTVGRGVTRPT
jgi:hypothetical protein